MILGRSILCGQVTGTFGRISLVQRYVQDFSYNKNANQSIIKTEGNTVQWNLKSLDEKACQVDLLLILNNPSINITWLKRAAAQASSIILVDGGANIFHSLELGLADEQISKVKGVIGDLDSLKPEVQKFYRQRNVKIIKDSDQQRNDFEKSLAYGIELGCRNILVSGAFGDRLDHTFGTMSIAEKTLTANPQVNMIMTNSSSIYCPLRAGFRHELRISSLISRVGCGLLTFQKIASLQTQGFKWNFSKKALHKGIEWGKFLSTSNQIISDQVVIESNKQDSGFINFVANFK